MKKSKIITISLLSLAAACVLVAVVVLCVMFIPSKTPDSITFLEDNGRVIIKTSQKDKGYGYTFCFREDNTKIYVHSDLKSLEYTQEVEEKGVIPGKTYSVSVAVDGEAEGAGSDYSKEVSWFAKKYLSSPEIVLNEGVISWEKVDLADAYIVSYLQNGQWKSFSNGNNLSFDVSVLPTGSHEVYVKSFSNKEYLLSSVRSNVLKSVQSVHALRSVSATLLDKVLTITAKEELEYVKIWVGNSKSQLKESIFKLSSPLIIDDGYVYSLNIDMAYNNEDIIGVSPFSYTDTFDGEVFYIYPNQN